ncbi:Protein of unknown function [Pyronema omphalodes CBS 100304]|uniref:Uncharacterized protein n=1 Tax=Pyronema omphalodes (strain CBS 100304) TaxID=1076935 RepID=U4LI25_PYROM|nr:Protein of unknown function [Pyronema omphalodes CBS 100304]
MDLMTLIPQNIKRCPQTMFKRVNITITLFLNFFPLSIYYFRAPSLA